MDRTLIFKLSLFPGHLRLVRSMAVRLANLSFMTKIVYDETNTECRNCVFHMTLRSEQYIPDHFCQNTEDQQRTTSSGCRCPKQVLQPKLLVISGVEFARPVQESMKSLVIRHHQNPCCTQATVRMAASKVVFFALLCSLALLPQARLQSPGNLSNLLHGWISKV